MRKYRLQIDRVYRCLFGLLAAAIVLGGPAAASENIEMHFQRIGISDGLSQSAVMAIAQDADGFMWFGTENGLDRYDGFEFRNYRRILGDDTSLPSDFVRDLAIGPDGKLWVATEGGVARYDVGSDSFEIWRHEPGDPSTIASNRVRQVHVDVEGRVWIATRDAGVSVLDPDSGRIRHFSTVAGDDESLPDNEVFSLAEDRSGNIWVATATGLGSINTTSGRVTRTDLGAVLEGPRDGVLVRALRVDTRNRLWIGIDREGLLRFDIETGAVARFRHDPDNHHSLPGGRIERVYEDSDHRIWVGTDRGLVLAATDSADFFVYTHNPGDSASLSDNIIISIFEDAGGILWFGSRTAGLNKWNPRSWSFGHHKPSESRADGTPNLVTSFTEDRDGRLWVGNFGAGIDVMQRSPNRLTHYAHDNAPPLSVGDNRVMALLTDSRGIVWAGTMTTGLHAIDPEAGPLRAYTNDPDDPSSLAANGIMALAEDSEGSLWIGTFGGGASRFDRASGTFTNFRHEPGDATSLSAPRATSIAEDAAGAIWVGTDGGGLNRKLPQGDGWQRFLHDPDVPTTLPANTVYALHTDASGRTWVGTRAGLSRIVPDDSAEGGFVFDYLASTHDLPRRAIYGIESDRHGIVWLSTSQGLVRFDPDSGSVVNFRRNHGLQGDEFNAASSYRNAAGELFFGGTNGFNAFDPDKLEFNRQPPKLALTSLSLMNEPAFPGQSLSRLERLDLGYKDDVVTFTVAALDFASPGENSFAYMLEGFDKDWVQAGSERRIAYTNLDGGDYTLRVRAANSDGVWNESGISLPITVASPPWQTWWAYLGYALIVLLALASIWRHQQQKLRREAEYSGRLELEVRSRTRQLKERNEELQTANSKLREVSITDALTGLRNRRFVFEQIGKDVDLVLRHYRDGTETLKPGGNNDLLFLMVDLDNFKPVNDTCGHEAGDELLLQVRDVLLDACRLSDDVIRWGGDEFLIIARETNPKYAANLAERIRSSLSQRVFSLGNGHVSRVTTSIGYASLPFIKDRPDLLGWEEVLGIADAAMYEAKQRRNSWVGIQGINWQGGGGDLCRAIKDNPVELAENGDIRVVESIEDVSEATA